MEDKLSEILIVLFLIFIILAPIICFFAIIDDIHRIREIDRLETQINILQQEIEYRDYVTNDNLNQ